MKHKLTDRQREVLEALVTHRGARIKFNYSAGMYFIAIPSSSLTAKLIHRRTFWSLQNRGLVVCQEFSGLETYRITPAGRKILSDSEVKEGTR